MSGQSLPLIRLVDLGRVDFWQTQAIYHALAESISEDKPDTILICQPASPYLCLGYHQVFKGVLDPQACQEHHLPVMRRRVGGGTTYLDENQLFYQCIFHHSRAPRHPNDLYSRLLSPAVETLRRLGLDAQLCSTNEIEVGGKRIAGTGGGRLEEAVVVVGNILFDFDYDTMARVWNVPSEAFRELAAIALRENLTTLHEQVSTISFEAVQEILKEEFSKALAPQVQPARLSPAEMRRAERVSRRLLSARFLNLHQPDHARASPRTRPLKISANAAIHAMQVQVNQHRIQASFYVRTDGQAERRSDTPAGRIKMARLISEPGKDWSEIEEKLKGAALPDRQALEELLADK